MISVNDPHTGHDTGGASKKRAGAQSGGAPAALQLSLAATCHTRAHATDGPSLLGPQTCTTRNQNTMQILRVSEMRAPPGARANEHEMHLACF